MAVYLQLTSNENLDVCISQGMWGANQDAFGNWRHGDKLIVYVRNQLAALFTVTGLAFFDDTPAWADNLYPHRIRIELEAFIPLRSRKAISVEQKDALNQYHPGWGTAIVLNHRPLSDYVAGLILASFDTAESQERVNVEPSEEIAVPEELTDHSRYQFYLGLLGSKLGYEVAIPKGDQTRISKIRDLAELNISEIPRFTGFSEKAQRTIANIDIIWFSENNPTHLFEVENTTGITDGILRMSDLMASIPYLNVEMYICASTSRKQQVWEVVGRPTFIKNNIAQKCRFLSYQALDHLMDHSVGLLSDLKASWLVRNSEALTN